MADTKEIITVRDKAHYEELRLLYGSFLPRKFTKDGIYVVIPEFCPHVELHRHMGSKESIFTKIAGQGV